jgi:ATP-dependent DNA ligase
MSNDMRREFGQNFDQYKGQVVEIHAFEQFVSGALRHPSFVRLRPDKLPTECIFFSKKPL